MYTHTVTRNVVSSLDMFLPIIRSADTFDYSPSWLIPPSSSVSLEYKGEQIQWLSLSQTMVVTYLLGKPRERERDARITIKESSRAILISQLCGWGCFPQGWIQSQDPTRQKERTDSSKISSGLHTYTVAQVHTNTWISRCWKHLGALQDEPRSLYMGWTKLNHLWLKCWALS